MCMGVLHPHMHVCAWFRGGLKTVLEALKLELWMVMS